MFLSENAGVYIADLKWQPTYIFSFKFSKLKMSTKIVDLLTMNIGTIIHYTR